MKKILALALAIVLALSTLSLTAFAAEADHGTLLDGVVNNADPSATFITAEIDGLQANESVEVKLYSGDTLLATTSWKKEFPIADAKGVMTTVKICITATSSSWETVWEEGKLSADYIPDKATLIVDGVECNTALIEMIDTDLEPVVWADIVPYYGTLLDGVVNNADPSATFITAEIDGLNAKESVAIKLYSGDTLLATTTWKKEFPIADAKGVITTVKICITATSSSWETVWEKGKLSADYIPDSATLIVDGEECNTALIEMIDTDLEPVVWADTVPYRGALLDGVVNVADPSATYITAEIDGLNAKESVAIKLYSGDTLLATTTWNKEFPIADEKGVMTTVKICITATSSSWKTVWETGKLSADYIPDKATLIVDDVVCNTALIEMIDTDLEPVSWAELVRNYYGTLLDGVVNNADPSATYITAEIDGLKANESVVIELYSGDALLATTTWNKEFPIADEKGVITTVKICITATSSSWKTVWENGMLSIDYIPDRAVLIVDGVECNSALIEMIDTDLEPVVWADLVPVSDIVVEDCENGTVIVNKETARAGETVEVTITPATDYKVDTVVITDAQGNTVAFENGSFKMPASAVTVVVTFKEHVPTYAVNVDVIGNGTVKLDKAEYEAGETVTINIKHPDGYMLYSLEVVDANGKPVAVKACTFVMPKGGATVYVEIVNDIPLPAKVYFEANVALEGAELEAGLFQFELSYLYKDSTIKVQTLKNSADGKIKFAPIAFYSPCEHTFYIKQVACNAEGVEYDATVYEIKVKVTYDKAGVLVATVAQTAVDFVNTAK